MKVTAADGNAAVAVLVAFFAVLNIVCFALSTKVAASRRAQAIRLSRPRPDYRLIAAMETDIYGEAFEHDGAPVIASTVRERGPGLDLYPPVQHFGMCSQHDDRARHYVRQREGGSALAAERKAFRAASVSASETVDTLDRLMNEIFALRAGKPKK